MIREDSDILAVVLAAGLGKRLAGSGEDSPKCMRIAAGKPLLYYVTRALDLPPEKVILVVGYKKEEIISAFPGYLIAVQENQRGTAHAVMSAAEYLRDFQGTVLVTCGDMPMFSAETFRELLGEHKKSGSDCTILADLFKGPILPSFGRIIRENGAFKKITEARDCTPEELQIRELNAGVYAFGAAWLMRALPEIKDNNAQRELYLTDAPEIIKSLGGKVGVYSKEMGKETLGVTTPEDLALIDKLLS